MKITSVRDKTFGKRMAAEPQFRPGFRFSPFDAVILIAGGIGSALTWKHQWWIGAVIALVVGHFFLFCNVFRISRALELFWAAGFIGLVTFTMIFGVPKWPVTFGLSLTVTVVVVETEMRKPSYHDVLWSSINPKLREWWDTQHRA